MISKFLGTSILKNIDLKQSIDEVMTAQITIVGFVMRLLLFRFFVRLLRPEFENVSLSWLADIIN